jgi:hypothetical protein
VTSDETLRTVARLLRSFHDDQSADADAIVVCHNDVRPGMVMFGRGRPTRLLPSTWAAPGHRRWDVAGAVWRWVPLLADWDTAELGFDPDLDRRGRRLRSFADEYGLRPADRAVLLDEVELRLEVADAIRLDERFAAVEGWAALRDERHGEGIRRDRWFVAEFRDRFAAHLAP